MTTPWQLGNPYLINYVLESEFADLTNKNLMDKITRLQTELARFIGTRTYIEDGRNRQMFDACIARKKAQLERAMEELKSRR